MMEKSVEVLRMNARYSTRIQFALMMMSTSPLQRLVGTIQTSLFHTLDTRNLPMKQNVPRNTALRIDKSICDNLPLF